MKVLTLILIGLSVSLDACYNCSYGLSAYCEDAAYSEESKQAQKEYEDKLAKEKSPNNHKIDQK